MTDLVIKDINAEYGEGSVGEFKVLIRKKNNSLNMSKMISQAKTKNGQPKMVKYWRATAEAQELVIVAMDRTGLSEKELFTSLMTGPNEFRGIYVHESLAPLIAAWASPRFGYDLGQIWLKYQKQEVSRELAVKEAQLAEKDGKILTLEQKIDLMQERFDNGVEKITRANDETHKKLDNSNKKLNKVNKKLDKTEKKVDVLTEKVVELEEDVEISANILEAVAEIIVPPAKQAALKEVFLVFNLNKGGKLYKCSCTQRKNVKATITKLMKTYPGASLLMEVNPDSNSKNLKHRLKDSFGKGKKAKIGMTNNDIILKDGVTGDDLKLMVEQVADEKYELTE